MVLTRSQRKARTPTCDETLAMMDEIERAARARRVAWAALTAALRPLLAELEPIKVKGKEEKVPIFRPTSLESHVPRLLEVSARGSQIFAETGEQGQRGALQCISSRRQIGAELFGRGDRRVDQVRDGLHGTDRHVMQRTDPGDGGRLHLFHLGTRGADSR